MRIPILLSTLLAATLLSACASTKPVPVIPVDTASVQPGTQVTRGGKTTLNLLGTPIRVGSPLPPVSLVDSNLKETSLESLKGKVLVLSVVPSLDTSVCERQTHILGDAIAKVPSDVRLLTISRDLPFAQARFARETGFDGILYLSDYRKAEFGQSTGLLVDQLQLLARSLIVVDRQGIVRYIQVVPELSHLPDLDKALAEAAALARNP